MNSIRQRIGRLEAATGSGPVSELTDDKLQAVLGDINCRWLAGEEFDLESQEYFRLYGMTGPHGERLPFRRARSLDELREQSEKRAARRSENL